MKHYFDFNLTGKKLLPIWLLFYALFITPYVFLIISIKNMQIGVVPQLYVFPILLVLFLIAFILIFYISKLIIEHVRYKGKSITFGGTFGEFIGTVFLGYFLSIITFGIYLPWFIRNVHSFFVDNSSYDSHAFKFQGKGGKLFKIITFTFILPMIILMIILVQFAMKNSGIMPASIIYIQQVIIWVLMIPYMYFVHKWVVNIDYKNYNITWETDFWNSCGKIAVEIFLSIITFGIYMPMAMLKLYKYFTEKTVVRNKEITRKLGFDSDDINDFLFIWGQLLLTIITFGIYYPWSICNVYSRLISKTYLE
ncbi:DUF6693 family protein [Flavobacterium undicola]|uniref:DUF6693 family protein n=1 Tax=Flavobacterium undicola TaxID=1932779 RepID=UPI0013785E8E|nr:DUF898 family protein [Flavobacterium undicola]MBA0885283.1 DUF898 family protein [Flavobacterium undicola]